MMGSASYPTFQVFLAIFIAMAITMAVLPIWIKLLKHRGIGQQVRADGPQRHLVKQGTPTMGGVIILIAMAVSSVVVAVFSPYIDWLALILVLLATLLTGLLGLVDDLTKVVEKRSLGLSPKAKLVGQIIISVVFCLIVVNFCGVKPTVEIPLVVTLDLGILTTWIPIGGMMFQIPWLYLLFVVLLMAGMSNSVNLTDGLDGLAGGCVMIAMIAMAAISYRADNLAMALFCGAVAGGCIGFLWFNTYPAQIFMGDTGSLAFGTALAAVGIVTKTEIVSLVIGGLFVAEAISVIIQVVHFKRTGKRVFLMAPFHHHLEKKGWSEPQVVTRLWIVSGFLACIGFAWYFPIGLM
ncbi:MAG: phospho-N-acetylmuramoyl-pentapeptide-transferase [Coriobacteriales bacterium]|jgi:phospho-N-acetylmuramoyl-pentapeptide-transferase